MKVCWEYLSLIFVSCSPAIILPDADLQIAANRIGFGKFYNCGQVNWDNNNKNVIETLPM